MAMKTMEDRVEVSPYKVKDISLAEFGRKEIEIAGKGNARIDGNS